MDDKKTNLSLAHPSYSAGFSQLLLKTLIDSEGSDDNIAIAPARLQAVVVLLANWAAPDVRKTLLEQIGGPGLTLEEANALFDIQQWRLEPSEWCRSNHKQAIPAIEQQTLLWAQNGLEIQQAAVDKVAENFALTIKKVDFNSPNLKSVMDAAIAHATHGLIRELGTKITSNTLTIITDILYFKAVWKSPFKDYNTQDQLFYGKKGTREVPMMHQTEDFRYAETPICQLIELPYTCRTKSCHGFLMRIYLPKPKKTISNVLNEIGTPDFRVRTETKEVQLSLPRFQVENNINMNDLIRKIGLGCLFDSDDIIPLCIKQLKIQQILQQAKVIVDEKGTEASAVTKVLMEIGCCPPGEKPKPIVMRVNHPFLFEIVENQTGTILFAGIINDVE